jgi:hypothetical protein
MKKKVLSRFRKRTKAKQAAFLRAFADNGSITKCAQLADINRTTHYEWLAQDARYKAAFSMARQMAKDAVFDELVRRGVVGEFVPLIYKGKERYATRKRVMCTLADGTTAFEDELKKDARVIQRRTVTTRGKQLGVYKHDSRALWAAIVGMPEGYGGTGLPK